MQRIKAKHHMSTTEKITLNLSVVDLGKIDLLVEEGFYTNRTDFMRSAIKQSLVHHSSDTESAMERQRVLGVGVCVYSKSDLERIVSEGKQLTVNFLGLMVFDKDVPPELAVKAVASVRVKGVFRATVSVKKALRDKIL